MKRNYTVQPLNFDLGYNDYWAQWQMDYDNIQNALENADRYGMSERFKGDLLKLRYELENA